MKNVFGYAVLMFVPFFASSGDQSRADGKHVIEVDLEPKSDVVFTNENELPR